jgi:multidrug efflux pump subunit AcrB
LKQITLRALSLVAGVLVDDAIVEIENIVRHMRMGKSCFQAAMDAADEIGLAVVATSFTIIAVFLPVSFMGGVSGQYFKQFGLTVAVAVFISLMVARIITPVLAAYALRSDSLVVHNVDGPIMTRYLSLLRWCVANRWKTIAAGFVFFVLSVVCLAIIPKAFVPPEDFANAQLDIELPPGGALDDTSRVSHAAAAVLRRSPEVTDIVEFVGGGEFGEIHNATIYVSLVPRSQRGMSQKEWEQQMMPLLNQVPDGHLAFSEGGGGRDIPLYLTGDDPTLVEATGHKVLAEMRALPEVRDVRIRGDLPRPEIVVHPRLDIAAQLGVSVQSISETIRIATLGDLPQNGAKFSLIDRQIPIRVSLIESARRDLTTLENLPVPTASARACRLNPSPI